MTLVALGQDGPVEVTKGWNPARVKRGLVRAALEKHLPEFPISLARTKPTDVTRKRINRPYGIAQIEGRLGMAKGMIAFVGNEVCEEGKNSSV